MKTKRPIDREKAREVFLSILTDYERISDLCENAARDIATIKSLLEDGKYSQAKEVARDSHARINDGLIDNGLDPAILLRDIS